MPRRCNGLRFVGAAAGLSRREASSATWASNRVTRAVRSLSTCWTFVGRFTGALAAGTRDRVDFAIAAADRVVVALAGIFGFLAGAVVLLRLDLRACVRR